MDEDSMSSFQTPETMNKEDGYKPNGDSKAKTIASKSKEKEIPRYLRASTGSCHDICKYGKKQIPVEKPWHSTTKKIFKKVMDDSSELTKREVLSGGLKYSSDSGSRSSGDVDVVKPTAVKKSNSAVGTIKSKVDHEKVASSSPVLKSKLGFKDDDAKIKKAVVVSKKVPTTPRSSISPRLPVKLAGISSLKKTQNLKTTSSQSLKAASSKSLEAASKQSLKAASSQSLKAASSKTLKAASSKHLKASPSQSLKPASKQSLKTASSPSSQSLKAASSRSLKASSSSDSGPTQKQRDVFTDESNQSDSYPVEEKTLHVVEIETTDKVPESDQNQHSVLEQSPQKEDESTVSESEEYEYISGSNESEEKKPRTIIEGESPEEEARKLSFRRGKIVNPETVNDTTRKLKFRKGRELGEEEKAKDADGRRSYKKREDFEEEEDENGEKVVLRHQDVQEKDAQGLFNNVIEETASKLVEARKSKVKALVGAFETVISLQEAKPASANSEIT